MKTLYTCFIMFFVLILGTSSIQAGDSIDIKHQFVPLGLPFKVELYTITSGFGNRIHPVTKKKKMHTGIDIRLIPNATILSTMEGTVKVVRMGHKDYGNYVVIENGLGFSTLYAHLSQILIYQGKHIYKNELIGLAGRTGNATGVHLHYEIRVNNLLVDPLPFIKTVL